MLMGRNLEKRIYTQLWVNPATPNGQNEVGKLCRDC